MPKYVLKAQVKYAGDGVWSAEIPGIPVPAVSGNGRDETVKIAVKAAADFLRDVNHWEDETTNPEPDTVTVVLEVNPEEPDAITFDLPPDLANAVERAVQEEGWDKYELARKALKKYLYDYRWEKMLRQNRKRARELGITKDDVQRIINEYRAERRQEAADSL